MATNSIIRYLLADSISLHDYICGKVPSFTDVKRRLLLLLRSEDKNVPDHYFRLNQQYSLKDIDSLPSLLTKGLYKLAEEHLEMINGQIYVKQSMQNSWQELITYIPPLILQMAFLYVKKPLCMNTDISKIREYCLKTILPNVKYTALPYPYIPEIAYIVNKQQGFHDLHIHLNGSTEADIVWQDLMMYPQKIMDLYNDSITNSSLAQEQIEQDFAPISTEKLEKLLLTARRIRQYLYMALFEDHISDTEKDKEEPQNKQESERQEQKLFNAKDLSEVISILINGNNELNDGIENPFASITIEGGTKYGTPLNVEGLMYILVLGYLVDNPKESVAVAFHLYLLILGFFNRLLVQQKHDYGFEEFQKYTTNGIRDNCEKIDYKTRFLQLCGNSGCNIAFVEGRFSPKLSTGENEQLISNITQGWKNCWKELSDLSESECNQAPKLKLIAHFIKKKDNDPTLIRHELLRKDIWERANVLARMKDTNSPASRHIIGVDAAASEFDAPPEVFAPAFRYLKRRGYHHFTYHAGEDFFHILGGLRSIYEAVDFLDFSYGDRIGHATAAGLSPRQWVDNVGEYIYMRKGEYLDDLVFAYNLITKYSNEKLKHTINNLVVKIHELYYSIYSHSYSIELISEVWKLRRLCPFHVFAGNKESAKDIPHYNHEEWCEVFNRLNLDSEASKCDCGEFMNEENERITMLRQYHCPKFKKKYDEIIEVKTTEMFSELDLEELQLMLLRYLNEKEIVIETLPTSNVRIGHHHAYDTYHLWNWIKWEKEGNPIPPIVVGTDDPGIFATNIYNEYSNIYCKLVYVHHVSRNQAMSVIEKLDKNARIYKFN
ncbi:MAG: hypothetical protein J6V44_03895 [Methanobrevibacter sp.]|nr:hypothetical protein [Methanobrevibacter sp.]